MKKTARNRVQRGYNRPNRSSAEANTHLRAKVVQSALYVVALAIFVRLIHIQIFSHSKYEASAKEQYRREYMQRAPRGIIYDRQYTTLALNKTRFDLGVDTRAVSNTFRLAKRLANILGKDTRRLERKLATKGGYMQLYRDIEEEDAKIIEALRIPGVKIIRANERLYPFRETLAQVIGFSDVDGKGLSGIELKFNDQLKGKNGWSILQKDARGKSVMPIASLTKDSRQGDNIVLTIDHAMQTIAEEELNYTVEKHNAKGGTVVVTNPATGEILAMASSPGFDANAAGATSPDAWRIRAITDIFEPGSTFKIVTMMLAIRDSLMKADDIIFCENGTYKLFGEVINDSHKHAWLTFDDVFAQSSNIGTAKIALKLGKEKIFAAARDFGFGNQTGIALPGEVSGILKKTSDWSRFSLAAMSYGHEIAVTALQIAMAYGAIANGGLLMKPAIIREIHSADSENSYRFRPQVIRKVMDARTSGRMRGILRKVVQEGSGVQAQIENIDLAGKTGTSQKPRHGNGGGYSNTDFVASFVGFYPTDGAKLLISVFVDEPFPVHSGGSVAAPTVKRILQRIISVYDSQRPTAPTMMTELSPSATQTAPDVIGMKLDIASKILNELNISYKTEGQGTYIKGQSTMTDKEDIVILQLENENPNSDYSLMPGLVGLSLRKAVAELSRRGLRAKVDGSGLVTSQQPAVGSKMKVGSQCYLECKPVVSVNLLVN